jgi:hypothetical protein
LIPPPLVSIILASPEIVRLSCGAPEQKILILRIAAFYLFIRFWLLAASGVVFHVVARKFLSLSLTFNARWARGLRSDG